jgi:hypothetical protein
MIILTFHLKCDMRCYINTLTRAFSKGASPNLTSLLHVSVPRWTSCRYALAMWGFYATMCLYLLRFNFSVAIVCMTYDEQDNDTEPVNKSSGHIAALRSAIYGDSFSEETCPNNGTAGEQVRRRTFSDYLMHDDRHQSVQS